MKAATSHLGKSITSILNLLRFGVMSINHDFANRYADANCMPQPPMSTFEVLLDPLLESHHFMHESWKARKQSHHERTNNEKVREPWIC